jgi:hypothetical protein
LYRHATKAILVSAALCFLDGKKILEGVRQVLAVESHNQHREKLARHPFTIVYFPNWDDQLEIAQSPCFPNRADALLLTNGS